MLKIRVPNTVSGWLINAFIAHRKKYYLKIQLNDADMNPFQKPFARYEQFSKIMVELAGFQIVHLFEDLRGNKFCNTEKAQLIVSGLYGV